MAQLVGFVPSIEFEMRFTGRELLYLLQAAKMHYDSACKAAAMHANDKGQKNGVLIRSLFYLGARTLPGRIPFKTLYLDCDGITDEQYLCENLDAEAIIDLSWNDVDLLCKISESVRGCGYGRMIDMNVAAGVYMGLNQALNQARLQYDSLLKQERLRRKDGP